jgi:dolichol-phosphate mannosyltransferase
LKNFGWAKKGLLAFSNTPINMLTYAGILLFVSGIVLSLAQIALKLLFPASAPKGVTTIMLLVLVLGSLNLLAASILGEYIGKIFEEVKGRPHFIRMNVIQSGEIRRANVRRGE